MSAIAATLLALCSSGDHIVCSNAVYGGTFALMKVSDCGINTCLQECRLGGQVDVQAA